MKPAPFGYHLATSVDEAVELLAAYEGTARPLAGGQSLAPMLNMRLVRPDALVDLNGIGGLDAIEAAGAGTRLGALTRYTALERSGAVAARLPLLTEVVRHVGDRQIRNRGTIGGSLSHGDPTAEIPLAFLALEARVEVRGPAGRREIAVRDLYEGSYATALDPLEVLTGVACPSAPRYWAFAELCRRHNDFAVVSVACVGDRDDEGRWSEVRIALGGVADVPVLADRAGALLTGSELSDEAIGDAARASLDVVDPPSDIRASAEYRRHLVPVYVRRVLASMRRSAAGPDGRSERDRATWHEAGREDGSHPDEEGRT